MDIFGWVAAEWSGFVHKAFFLLEHLLLLLENFTAMGLARAEGSGSSVGFICVRAWERTPRSLHTCSLS